MADVINKQKKQQSASRKPYYTAQYAVTVNNKRKRIAREIDRLNEILKGREPVNAGKIKAHIAKLTAAREAWLGRLKKGA